MNPTTELNNAKQELFHLEKMNEFRSKKSKIKNLIKQLKSESKSIDWEYIEDIISSEQKAFTNSEMGIYYKVFALDFVLQSLEIFDKELSKNFENIKKKNNVAQTLCEMSMLDKTMKNYESNVDEGYPLVHTHGRPTTSNESRYNLRHRF